MQIKFVYKLMRLLWPHLSPAIHREVIEQSREPIRQTLEKIPFLKNVRLDVFDLGERPFRIDSIKSYVSNKDEIMIEAPVFWGGDFRVRVVAVAQIGGKEIDLPIDISCIQIKALARIVISPLVEQLPCAGGVTVSLLERPTFDMDFRILDSPDLLSIPPMPIILRAALHLVAGKMIVYPNEFSVPLMPNYGLPDPPKGILRVNVVSGHGLKSSFMDRVDPFVQLEIREGRPRRTKTIQNEENPVWNETIDLIVDDFEKQSLRAAIMDDDIVSASTVGGTEIELKAASFIKNPNEWVRIYFPVFAPRKQHVYPKLNEEDIKVAAQTAIVEDKILEKVSKIPRRKGIIPHLRRKMAAKKAKKEALDSIIDEHESAEVEAALLASEAASNSTVDREPGSVTGNLKLELKFIPFQSSLDSENDTSMQMKRRLSFKTSGNGKNHGVLSICVIKAAKLGSPKSTFLEISVSDPTNAQNPDIKVTSSTEINEQNPKYNFKSDFVDISPKSNVTFKLFEQPGLMDTLSLRKIPFVKSAPPRLIGYVTIPASDIESVGQVREVYALKAAQTGELYIAMSWLALELE